MVASETAGLSILTSSGDNRFTANTTLPLRGPVRVERLGDDSGALFAVTNRQGPTQTFLFTESTIITPVELTVSKLKHYLLL